MEVVIGFGGSYGGLLGFRMKYPFLMDGACNRCFRSNLSFQGEQPPIDASAFLRIVTRDATAAAAGSAPHCADHV